MSQTEPKVTINRAAGKAPRDLALAIVAGQAYPFLAKVTHKCTFPLVVPSTGLPDALPPGEEVTFKVKNFEQAWLLVTDLAEFAHRADDSSSDFATVTPEPAVVPPADPATELPKPTKPGKGATNPATEEASEK